MKQEENEIFPLQHPFIRPYRVERLSSDAVVAPVLASENFITLSLTLFPTLRRFFFF